MRRPNVYQRSAPRARRDRVELPDPALFQIGSEINAGGRCWLLGFEGWADIGVAKTGLPDYDDREDSRIWPRARFDPAAPVARSAKVARSISRALPALIDAARAEGLDSLADALEIARRQAELSVGDGRVVVVE